MGSTIQIFVAGLAWIVNTLLLIIMTFASNIVLSPIFNALGKFVVGPQAVPMANMSYIVPSLWAIIIIMEIVCSVSFYVVASRNNEVSYEAYY
jgi:hypothetical protein